MSKFLFTVVSCFICTSLNAQENNQYGNFNVGDDFYFNTLQLHLSIEDLLLH